MKTIFHNVPREQLIKLVLKGIDALADKRNFDTFTIEIETQGGMETIQMEADYA